MARVNKVGHVVLNVADVDNSIEFYTEALGMELMSKNERGMAFLSFGSQHHDIALFPAPVEAERGTLGLNHIALRVTDVSRSRDFYLKHLGLKVRREEPERNCFMTCGDHFVALFHADRPRMDHFCFSIKGYDQEAAAKKLQAHGIEPETPRGTNRIYFKDPDGIKVQLAAIDHRP